MPFDQLRRTLDKAVAFDVKANVTDIINSNQQYLTGLLKKQLSAGKDANNEPVLIFGRDQYSFETFVAKKQMRGLAGETRWITNYMSGNFYRFLFVEARGDKFEFFSAVEYFWEIIQRSDSVIMELSVEHLQQFQREVLKPELQRRFNEFVNGF